MTGSWAAKTGALLVVLIGAPLRAGEPGLNAREVTHPAAKRSVPIFYDPALTARGFPSPMLKIRIDSQEALFIIDTGASVNTLADWLVEVAQIPSATSSSTTQGTSGREVPLRVVHQVHGRLNDGEPITLKEAIVVTFPPLFRSLNLGGLISPQLLPPIGMAVDLDLRKPALLFIPKVKTAASSATEVCRNPDSQFTNRLYLAAVSIGASSDLLLLDTGATATLFSENSMMAREYEGRAVQGRRFEGVGGAVEARRFVPNVGVLRGGSTIVLNPSIGNPGSSCGSRGILGMDGLRACRLVLDDRSMMISCDAEPSIPVR